MNSFTDSLEEEGEPDDDALRREEAQPGGTCQEESWIYWRKIPC